MRSGAPLERGPPGPPPQKPHLSMARALTGVHPPEQGPPTQMPPLFVGTGPAPSQLIGQALACSTISHPPIPTCFGIRGRLESSVMPREGGSRGLRDCLGIPCSTPGRALLATLGSRPPLHSRAYSMPPCRQTASRLAGAVLEPSSLIPGRHSQSHMLSSSVTVSSRHVGYHVDERQKV